MYRRTVINYIFQNIFKKIYNAVQNISWYRPVLKTPLSPTAAPLWEDKS